jgi:acyl-CoA thioesterase-1
MHHAVTEIRQNASPSTLLRLLPAVVCGLALVLMIMTGRPAQARTIKLVAFGDSLTAGFGLEPADAFPAQLELALRANGHDVTVVNAGVSGETAGEGLARLDASVPADADGVIVELGANDILMGLDPNETRAALETIVTQLEARGVRVLLAGMIAPPGTEPAMAKAFNRLYGDIAEKHGILLNGFFLEGVAGNPALTLPDGLHPNAMGVQVIIESILPDVERLLAQIRQ